MVLYSSAKNLLRNNNDMKSKMLLRNSNSNFLGSVQYLLSCCAREIKEKKIGVSRDLSEFIIGAYKVYKLWTGVPDPTKKTIRAKLQDGIKST